MKFGKYVHLNAIAYEAFLQLSCIYIHSRIQNITDLYSSHTAIDKKLSEQPVFQHSFEK